jgi:hypothetical protein
MPIKWNQKNNFRNAIGEQARIETEVKTMLANTTPLLQLVNYIIFAKQVVKLSKKYRGETLYGEMEILQNLWEGRGLDKTLMNQIKKYYVPSYPVIMIEVCKFDVGKFDVNGFG